MVHKKQEIIKKAVNLFVEFGFHATPTSKIAKAAGVANGTLFHYFTTKEELILSLYIETNKQLAAYVCSKIHKTDSLEITFKTIVTNRLEWAQTNKQEFYFIQQFLNSPYHSLVPSEETDTLKENLIDCIHEGINAGVLKSLPVGMLYTLIISHIDGINHYLFSSEFSAQQQREIIHTCFELLWDMISYYPTK